MAINAYFDRENGVYAPGDEITLTVETAPGERDRDLPIVVSVHIEGVGTAEVKGTVDKPDEPIIISDPNRAWTKASDNGVVAVFTAIV